MNNKPDTIKSKLSNAVAQFWATRQRQVEKQTISGQSDQGLRGAVTGGAQMDGFIELISELIIESGVDKSNIFNKKRLELPGYFRATKEWDLLVVRENQLILALEVKSQVGPSFGNNFNNRIEEAIGSALDLWTAYREGALNKSIRPWLGYLFLLEDCPNSNSPVKIKEPHFQVFPEFANSSYTKRYELFCRKIVRERLYNAAAFLTSEKSTDIEENYTEPADDLTFRCFTDSLFAQTAIYGQNKKND